MDAQRLGRYTGELAEDTLRRIFDDLEGNGMHEAAAVVMGLTGAMLVSTLRILRDIQSDTMDDQYHVETVVEFLNDCLTDTKAADGSDHKAFKYKMLVVESGGYDG